ncbi:MAG: class I SAM-dependent methyltransferase [Candidatus Thorarchaeota archaeon]
MNISSVRKRYDWYSRFYDKFEQPMEQMVFRDLRSLIIGALKGKILEVGVGTGKNIQYYQSHTQVIGVDISPNMLKKAKQKISSFHGNKIELKLMDAEELSFKDETFNIVLCTFVLCSVPNPANAIQEMLRVLRSRGRLILLEHVLSKMSLIAYLQKIANPFTRGIFGFNIDRDTLEILKQENVLILKDQNLTKTDILKFLVCEKPNQKIVDGNP